MASSDEIEVRMRWWRSDGPSMAVQRDPTSDHVIINGKRYTAAQAVAAADKIVKEFGNYTTTEVDVGAGSVTFDSVPVNNYAGPGLLPSPIEIEKLKARARKMANVWDADNQEPGATQKLSLKRLSLALRAVSLIGRSVCNACQMALEAPLSIAGDGRLWHEACYERLRCRKCEGPKHVPGWGLPNRDMLKAWQSAICGYCLDRDPVAGPAMKMAKEAAKNAERDRQIQMYQDKLKRAAQLLEDQRKFQARKRREDWINLWRELGLAYSLDRIRRRAAWLQAWKDIAEAHVKYRVWLYRWCEAWGVIGHTYHGDRTRYLNKAYVGDDPTLRRFGQIEIGDPQDTRTSWSWPVTQNSKAEEDDPVVKRFKLLEIDP